MIFERRRLRQRAAKNKPKKRNAKLANCAKKVRKTPFYFRHRLGRAAAGTPLINAVGAGAPPPERH